MQFTPCSYALTKLMAEHKAVACLQVLAMPAMTFNVDTLGFCKPFSLLELIFVLVYFIFATSIVIGGAAAVDVAGYFGFYQVHSHYD